jgi:hypothetical protein
MIPLRKATDAMVRNVRASLRRLPTERSDLLRVDRIAAIMAGAVVNLAGPRLGLALYDIDKILRIKGAVEIVSVSELDRLDRVRADQDDLNLLAVLVLLLFLGISGNSSLSVVRKINLLHEFIFFVVEDEQEMLN